MTPQDSREDWIVRQVALKIIELGMTGGNYTVTGGFLAWLAFSGDGLRLIAGQWQGVAVWNARMWQRTC